MLRRVSSVASRHLKRLRKHLRQRRRLRSVGKRTPVFVVGFQRSGTNMFMDTVDRSPLVWIYNEDARSAFVDFRLRPAEVIERLIERSPGQATVFKPLCDSHLTDRLLDRHSGSKAIWIYRRYADAVNSGLRLWGGNERAIRWIAEERWQELDWRGERLSNEAIELVRRLHRKGISRNDATALFWYIRTGFYFELGLDRDPRVLLARYEDLVGDPEPSFRRAFEFMGCECESEFLVDIFSTSIGREEAPDLLPEIASLCDARMRQFDECYAASRG